MTDKQQAIQTAAAAVRAHMGPDRDTATLHDMQKAVQAARNLGATSTDIADASRDH